MILLKIWNSLNENSLLNEELTEEISVIIVFWKDKNEELYEDIKNNQNLKVR